ncbi:MAG TPA: EAL domain-containing protein [Candidatus Cryosericum sp.]|nr:EAL domain-containing protein [Candidatus Cryosericum sp.]
MRDIIVSEFLSCIILAVICVYSLMGKRSVSYKQVAFHGSAIISFIALLITFVTFYLTHLGSAIPPQMLRLAGSMFYLGMSVAIASITGAMLTTMFENRLDSRRFKCASIVASGLLAVQILIIVANLFTGWLFSVHPEGIYTTGALYRIDLIYLILAYFNVYVFYRLERKRVKGAFRLIIYTIPAIIALMCVFQYFYLDMILTGTILSVSLLVLFIYGQQQRLYIDPLTEISNREAFFQSLEHLAARHTSFRVIFVSLRKYKLVNNQFGQRVGDEFLLEIGRYFSSLNPKVTPYRFSGVEFALVEVHLPTAEYEELLKRVKIRFDEPWFTEGLTVAIDAAVCDIRYPDHAADINELIASLEYAMRLAKCDVNNKLVRFSGVLRGEFGRRNFVLSQMERSLREGRFFLYIQPIYDCALQRYIGGEVLLRMNEENGRPIPPGEFIPLAIETGLATELGWMVLEKTCRFLSLNRDVGWLSVNISSQQNEFDETVRRLETLLEKYDIPPECIKLEITESVLFEDLERARITMEELGRRGVGVFLDDFGTGYSNLSNVMSLPFECVKIDKGLLGGIQQNEKSYRLLQTVVNGLRSMNMLLLAEGVETLEQNEMVRHLGIDLIQGYYYARPMPSEEFVWQVKKTPQVLTAAEQA